MKVLPLKGYKSLRALNAFNSLLLGLKMLPAYEHEDFEPFLERIQNMPEKSQRVVLKEAAMFVEVEPEELRALVSFCTDANGIPYSAENIENLGPDQFIEIIVEVCMEISKIKIDIVTETEKKK